MPASPGKCTAHVTGTTHSGQGTGHIGAARLPEDHTRLTCQQEHGGGGLGTLSVVTAWDTASGVQDTASFHLSLSQNDGNSHNSSDVLMDLTGRSDTTPRNKCQLQLSQSSV